MGTESYVVARPGAVKLGAVGAIEAAAIDLGSTKDATFTKKQKETSATSTKYKGAKMRTFLSEKEADAKLTLEEVSVANAALVFDATDVGGTITDNDTNEATYYSAWIHGFLVGGVAKVLHFFRCTVVPEADISLDGSQQYLPLAITAHKPEASAALFEWVNESADTTAPTVTIVPAAGATAVAKAITTLVVWTFAEAIRAEDVKAKTFMVTDDAGNAKAGTLSINAACTEVTFTPGAAWAATTKFLPIINGVVRDVAGNELVVPVVKSFTTGA